MSVFWLLWIFSFSLLYLLISFYTLQFHICRLVLYFVYSSLTCCSYSSGFSPAALSLLVDLSLVLFIQNFLLLLQTFFFLSCSCFMTSISLISLEIFNILILKLFSNCSISSLLGTSSSPFWMYCPSLISLYCCMICSLPQWAHLGPGWGRRVFCRSFVIPELWKCP